MSTEATHQIHDITHDHHEHEHHWETSWAPLVLVAGIFFLVPIAFSGHFVYENQLMTIIGAGLGVPMILAGVAKWVQEGMSHKNLVEGVSIVGLPIFIVSEIFIFLGLFASYWTMRLSAGINWPPEGTPEISTTIPLIMTVILVSSSFTMHNAEIKLDDGDNSGFNKWLIITIVLGTVFLGFTVFEYNHLIHAGFVPGTNSYSSAFFSITGFHASHVFIGLALFVAVLIPALKGKTNDSFVACASVYWHFVDVVWFFVVSQIYFW
ncbi:MAG: heme-copper oxidase subunit III [Rhodospirillaceae bacterium]|jgi:cytochrome c oxidase subunit 3|nr:heme-copper oxidase subunit III [Rhodospirillaceae bacterium]MBT5560802.1 heme-copper oxidase subunit III [Rhodospirillaceae bacterium]MBT6240540.1 heme-copper oxidase subunit III [Rhodospirillaceae bacterium]